MHPALTYALCNPSSHVLVLSPDRHKVVTQLVREAFEVGAGNTVRRQEGLVELTRNKARVNVLDPEDRHRLLGTEWDAVYDGASRLFPDHPSVRSSAILARLAS